ncbi:MAG: electron transfer flavoprotein alpha subunit [Paraglaciecola sp.]|jgi:electron transfer flavoprotein alpha subunit
MSVLVLAQHDNSSLDGATRRAVTAGKQLSNSITVLVAGGDCEAVAQQARNIEGVKTVLYADAKCYREHLAENLAKLISELAPDFTHIVAVGSTFGKNVLPRLGALLNVQPISDVVAIESENIFVRPIYAGDLLARIQSEDHIKVLTVRGTAFDEADKSVSLCALEPLNKVFELGLSELVKRQITLSDCPDLETARVVVSGGKALGSSENFNLVYRLAKKFNGAVGASRAAVDAGFVPNELQIGQTGRMVAPNLYIAVGISGAVQHLAGMKDSKVVVAINKDPDAAIFGVSDYGIVADLFEILPELEAHL